MADYYDYSRVNSNYIGKVTMWESATDTVANTSTISWTFKVYRSDAYYVDYDRNTGNNFTLMADGTARTNPSPYTNFSAVMKTNGQHESTANTWVSSDMCGSFVVQHNADGAKSFSFTAKYWNTKSGSIGSSSSPLSVSGTFYCTTFARAASVTATDCTMGDHSVITINKETDAFYYRLRYWFNGKSGVIAEKQWGAVKWFYPEIADFAPYCTDAKSKVCTIYCETHSSDGTLIGETHTYITISVPSSLAPTLSVSTALVDGFNGNYLQNMSRCRLTMTATTQYQATVSSYTINGLTNASNPYTSAVITESGSKTYTVTVYDSRGFSASITTQAINVLPYSLPSMTNITVARCLQDGTPATNGTYLSVYAKANYANVSGNSASMSVAWKLTSASSYGTAESLPSETTTIVGGGNILAQRAYNVKLTITDTVGNTVDAVLMIPSDSVSINERAENKGVGIGTYADEDNTFKVNTNWVSKFGTILSNGNTVVPVVSQSIGASQGYVMFASGLAVCWKRVSITISCDTAWGSMYETASAVSFGNMPYTFRATPVVTATLHSDNAAMIENIFDTSASSFGSAYFCRASAMSGISVTIDLFAIGLAAS